MAYGHDEHPPLTTNPRIDLAEEEELTEEQKAEIERVRLVEQKKVDDWNKKNPVGRAVTLTLESGEKEEDYTRSRANLIDNRAIVWLRYHPGRWSLDQIETR